jgi:dTDP-4-dehydrorhamnose 3,5-epimerase
LKLLPTPLPGAFVVQAEPLRDERGFFARTFDAETFAAAGLDARVVQCSTSVTSRAGTLRGMHYQAEPHGEAKLVRCTAGAMWDVAVDLRPRSPTHRRWFGTELTAENRRMLFVPVGCAQGYQTLADDTEVLYLMGHPYVPEAARGARWDDPALGIAWPPAEARTISERDEAWPLLDGG